MCGAGACVLSGCAAVTDPGPPLTLTVSAVTPAPMTVWFDVRERSPSGLNGPSVDATPVELTPAHPSAVVPVPRRAGNWVWTRVAGPADRNPRTILSCELRAPDGRVLAVDATDPLGPSSEDAACGGAG
ncbi:hypothetical protein [Actinomycetospora sp. NBRC 106378]|uniref:hypothetical protein n=1 Tax=Actinomycetospora sp. NBRC 106378 TaxID=3032208 RepID=UPI0024A06FCB|nr:hypothetical protein [Actinomycetospora sp. NBRC 106378]GLZ52612.1 hypothetical protein Acsp07_22290 [Actinomycetospora sp. NBRC 106378]